MKEKYDSNEDVILSVINSERIKATLSKHDSIIKTKIVKGKMKNGYFSVRAQYHIFGLPFIYFIEYDNKVDLTINQKGQLYMAITESKLGWIFIASAGDTYNWSATYNKQK